MKLTPPQIQQLQSIDGPIGVRFLRQKSHHARVYRLLHHQGLVKGSIGLGWELTDLGRSLLLLNHSEKELSLCGSTSI